MIMLKSTVTIEVKRKDVIMFKKFLMMLMMAAALTFAATGCGEADSSAIVEESDEAEISDTDDVDSEGEEEQGSEGVAASDGSTMDMTGVVEGDFPDFDQTAAPKTGDQIVTFDVKDFGEIKAVLFPEVAPYGVKNFTLHANEGYYDGLTFHRIISNFMIQGGDPDGNGTGGESIWKTPFYNETAPQACIIRGSLCYANAGYDPSNGSQFFITQLDTVTDEDLKMYEEQGITLTEEQKEIYKKNGGAAWLQGGYTVFGQVYEGMDIVDEISKVSTDDADKPLDDVIINKVTISEYE